MLYQNAWYFWRLEPPFILPKFSIFAKLILLFRFLGGNPFTSEASAMLYQNAWYNKQ